MINYKLFANVIPLEPNTSVIVLNSDSIGDSNLNSVREYMVKKGLELKAKGYRVSILKTHTIRKEL